MQSAKMYLISFIVLVLSISLLAGDIDNLPDFNPDANMSRNDVPDIFKWDLTDLCESDAKWDKDIKIYQSELKSISTLHQDLNTAKGLLKYMEKYFAIDDNINRLTLYASLQRDAESTNQEAITRHELGLKLTEELMQEGAILRQTILGLSD